MPNMKLIVSIINYLKEEAKKETADTQESLEVAVQCLQTAYDLDPKDFASTKRDLCMPLEDIFNSATAASEDEIEEGEASSSTGQSVNKAEIMKNLGNNLMRNNQYTEAVRYYTAAIEIDSHNAVYYCNRAAAYSKLNDFQNAVKDCEKAVAIDPKYAKAYGRMGLAYTSLDQIDLAIKAFNKALEIEPGNESYENNMKIALDKKEKGSSSAQGASATGGFPGLSSVDWQTLFSNPAFRNMASTIMQDPNIISALSAGMSSSLNQASAATAAAAAAAAATTTTTTTMPGGNNSSTSTAAGNRSFDMLLEAGQYLAAQMQAANPDLVEQFRNNSGTRARPPNSDKSDSAQ